MLIELLSSIIEAHCEALMRGPVDDEESECVSNNLENEPTRTHENVEAFAHPSGKQCKTIKDKEPLFIYEGNDQLLSYTCINIEKRTCSSCNKSTH